jgi:two-component system phosphate regulon response regulator PhoB
MADKEHILVVEDEVDLQELVKYSLQKKGLEVTSVGSAEQALPHLRDGHVDLMILDLMLPGIDGLELCRMVRSDPSLKSVPILIVSALGDTSDIVTGLELGADDYLTKPFSPAVLVARVRAILRRHRKPKPTDMSPILIDDLAIHPGRHQVIAGDTEIPLSLSEFQILYCLAQSPGWVFTRYQILDKVRGEEAVTTDRVVDVHITSLRKKLGNYSDCIETVRGVGYRFRSKADASETETAVEE